MTEAKKNVVALKPNAEEGVARSALQKDIKVLAGSLAKANENIHNIGIRCMEHCQNYGGVNETAAALVDAMPLSHRRELLIRWFADFSPIVVAKDATTGKMRGHLKGVHAERVWNIEPAKATPFYAMPGATVEPNVPTYESIHDNIVAFVKRMAIAIDKIPDDEEKAKATAEVEKLKAAIAA